MNVQYIQGFDYLCRAVFANLSGMKNIKINPI